MLLFEKYRPNHIHEFFYNQNILEKLSFLASFDDIPHIIISGPHGSGKKTLTKFFLEALYGPRVNHLSEVKYHINGSSQKNELTIMQSDYHIVIEPSGTNHDKYILQEIIKQYAKFKAFEFLGSRRTFKTIVIYNIEVLSNNSQAALRRTMERYAKTCRLIMVCNNLSKIFDPCRSRCYILCVPKPTINEISRVIQHIAILEGYDLNKKKIEIILSNCNNNIKQAIWILESLILQMDPIITVERTFQKIISNILLPFKKSFNKKTGRNLYIFNDFIRSDAQHIQITTMKGSDIISKLMDMLIEKIDNDNININIIRHAADAESNLIIGRRDIMHIEHFINSVIKELKDHNYVCPEHY